MVLSISVKVELSFDYRFELQYISEIDYIANMQTMVANIPNNTN